VYRADVHTPTHPRRKGLLALAVALPLGLAACSSSASTSTTTTRASGHSDTTSACTLVTPAQIESTLGRTVDRPVVVNSTAATACTYTAADRSNQSDSVVIGFRGRVTSAVAGAEQATVRKLHGTTTDVSGTGDSAYSYTTTAAGGHTVNTLVTLVGLTQVTVSSTATVAQEEALTQQIFSSLASASTSTTTSTTVAG
jgi:hypothetical protein